MNERDGLETTRLTITHARGRFYGWSLLSGGIRILVEGKHLNWDQVIVDVCCRRIARRSKWFYDGKKFGRIPWRHSPPNTGPNKSTPAGTKWSSPRPGGHSERRIRRFLTGFVVGNTTWGRPVGVAVASDGSLMVTDDASKSIWRVTYVGK